MALNKFGEIRAFGENTNGQCSVPFGLGAYRAIAAGDRHSLAIRSNGQVVAWGSNSDGQRSVPADLGVCVDIAAGAVHSVALKANGLVRAWGANGAECINCDLGQTGINGLQGVSAIAAGGRASIAILSGSKTVAGFGKLGLGCDPVFYDELNLGFRSATMGSHAFGVTFDGRACGAGSVSEWWGYYYCGSAAGTGNDDFSQSNLPPGVARWVQIASGNGGYVAGIVESDCNDDGIEDAAQIDGRDCNGNGRLDSCDALVGIVEDCNANGIGDECEKELTVDLQSGRRGPFGTPNAIVWEIPAAPTALGWVTISGNLRGDFSSPAEYVTVRLGSTVVGTLVWPNAQDCAVQQFFVGNGISPEVFNAAIRPDGTVQVSFTPSAAVNPSLCAMGTWLEASLAYTAAAPSDCNANGILDACEIASGTTPDSNGNGRPDSCDAGFGGCSGDLVSDGVVNGADLGELLAAWGAAAPNASADINRDGTVNGADLGELLANWGPCGT